MNLPMNQVLDRVRPVAWSLVAALVAAPWIAMQVTDQVAWTGFDFALFGALLVGAGVAVELAVRSRASAAYRLGALLALATAGALVVVSGAVGVIASENHPANLLMFGVLALAAAGALLARFRARGLALALTLAAAAQVAVGLTALIAGWGERLDAAMATTLFTGLWLAAAWLFRKAA